MLRLTASQCIRLYCFYSINLLFNKLLPRKLFRNVYNLNIMLKIIASKEKISNNFETSHLKQYVYKSVNIVVELNIEIVSLSISETI